MAAGTCLGLLKEWYAIRRELEDWWSLPPNEPVASASEGSDNHPSFYWKDETISRVQRSREGAFDSAHYFGYCDKTEAEGYHRLVEPDGPKT